MRSHAITERAILIAEADRVFAIFIKQRDKWTCVRCHKPSPIGSKLFTCSHFKNKRYLKVRWNPANADGLHKYCHTLWEYDKKGEYLLFKQRQLGNVAVELLKKEAQNTSYHITNDQLKLIISRYKSLIGE